MRFSESDHAFEKTEDILIRREPAPVQPDGGVINIIRIVVASLSIHELITRAEHRCSVGEHQKRAEVLNLLLAQRGDRWRGFVVAWTDAIPAKLTIVVVGDQIVKARTVMAVDKVNTLTWAILGKSIVVEEIAAAV